MKRTKDYSLQFSLGFDAVDGVPVKPITIPYRKSKNKTIEDFGEKIGGARKDIAAQYLDRLRLITDDILATKPLSQVFPRPNLTQLVKDGQLSISNAIWLKYSYDMIPTKPRRTYRIKNWVKQVRSVIDMSNEILSDNPDKDFMEKHILLLQEKGYHQEALRAQTYVALANSLNYPDVDFNLGNLRIAKFYAGPNYGIIAGDRTVGEYDTFEAAIDELNERFKNQKTEKGSTQRLVALSVYQNRKTEEIYIGKTIQGRQPVKLLGNFSSARDAFKYLEEHRQDLELIWKQISNIPDERRSTNNPRVGIDWRKGENVTPELFAETFGFRGVEFGNWVKGIERQTALNEAYDALMDLSIVVRKSPRALSLNGELALAFGARGNGGNASAHYEPFKVVINLTKTKGAGTLAHEWFHALDNYFSRQRMQSLEYLSTSPYPWKSEINNQDPLREDLLTAFADVISAINHSDFAKRAASLDRFRSKTYWSLPTEMGARVFENYVIERLEEEGITNEFLAQFKTLDEWGTGSQISIDSYPYPLKDESFRFKEKFDQLFETIQEKVDKDTRRVLLFKEQTFFSNAENAVLKISQERAQAKQWLAMLQNSGGIKVAEDRWMGLSEWLSEDPQRMLTKSDVLQFINANKIEVNEVLLSNEKPSRLEWEQVVSSEFNYYQAEHDGITYIITPSNQEFRIFDLDGIELGYRSSIDEAQNYVEQLVGAFATDATRNAKWTTSGIDNLKTLVLSIPNIESWSQEDVTHYGDIADGKAIAWVRFGDVSDESGRKILLVDEIQSKRHQEGRHFGYRTPAIDAEFQAKQKFYTALKSELSVKYGTNIEAFSASCLSDDDRARLSRAYDDMNIEKYISRVPEAPFEKQWHELAFKRILRYAAEEGYDAIAWTTGEHQSERYDLSSKLDAIEFRPCNKTGFPGIVTLKFPNDTSQTQYVPNEVELSRIVGKEVAEKIGKGNYHLSTRDMKVGFAGMKGFYDKILVDFANHYAKKWDSQVHTVNLPVGEKGHTLMHSMDITPEMSQSLFQGQPLFKEDEYSHRSADDETKHLVGDLLVELSEKFHIPINIVQSIDALPSHLVQAFNKKRMFSRDSELRLPGVYDPESGTVHFVLNEIHSVTEASCLFLHEVVAHKGIDGLLGKNKACQFYGQVFDSLDRATQELLMHKYHNKFVAGAEYVALIAEENKKPSVIERIISFFRDILRSIGITLQINNEDIRLMLANSRKYLQNKQKIVETQQKTKRRQTTDKIAEPKTNSKPKLML